MLKYVSAMTATQEVVDITIGALADAHDAAAYTSNDAMEAAGMTEDLPDSVNSVMTLQEVSTPAAVNVSHGTYRSPLRQMERSRNRVMRKRAAHHIQKVRMAKLAGQPDEDL
jgi:hypothetical protein